MVWLFMREKFRVGVMVVFVIAVLIFSFNYIDFDFGLTGYAVFGDNLIERDNGDGSYNLEIYGGIVNYFDGDDYVPFDTSIVSSSDALFDYENVGQLYDVYFKEDPTAGQVVKYVKDSVETTFQPMALNYRNSLSMIDQINDRTEFGNKELRTA